MKQKFRSFVLAALTVLFITSCNKNIAPPAPHEISNKVVLQWNEVAYNAFGGAAYQNSLMASRINAMVHLAMHDALNGIEEKYERYAYAGQDKKADPVVSAAYAAYTVLLNEIPAKKTYLDSALALSIGQIEESDAKIRGIKIGKEAGQAVIEKRATDGSVGEVIGVIPPSDQPGIYQEVPPFNFVFAPYWENVKLFSLQSKHQFRVAPLPALDSDLYTAAIEEVKETGSRNSTTRTADQTAYSKFWYEFSEAGWNRVARQAVIDKNLNLLEAARLFALVDMAMADAYVAGWDSKIHYNFWRPYTAIRKASIDGNDLTHQDPDWEPLENTPPVQDYPSTHSALGNAAAVVLTRLLGDQVGFTMSSPTALPQATTRTFTSFMQAANENADSRVRAGIHFRFSCNAGQEMGSKIGNWVVDNSLKAIN